MKIEFRSKQEKSLTKKSIWNSHSLPPISIFLIWTFRVAQVSGSKFILHQVEKLRPSDWSARNQADKPAFWVLFPRLFWRPACGVCTSTWGISPYHPPSLRSLPFSVYNPFLVLTQSRAEEGKLFNKLTFAEASLLHFLHWNLYQRISFALWWCGRN